MATVPLTELLQLISSGLMTGILTLRDPQHVKRIYFQNGEIVSSLSNHPSEYLGQFLLSEGKITEEQLRKALQTQEKSGILIGKILVMAGILSEEELQRALVSKAEETIFSLFLWKEGEFDFEEGKLPPQQLVPISLKVQEILLKGAKSCDDLERMRQELGSVSPILRRTSRPAPLGALSDRLAACLYGRLDGKISIPELCLEFRCTEFSATKALYELHKAGYAELAGAAPADTAPGAEGASVPELLGKAEEMTRAGKLGHAIELHRQAVSLSPSDETIRQSLERAEGQYVEKARKHLLPLHKIPVLRVDMKELMRENLSPEEGFLVSRINGTWDLKSIISISPLREVDALLCVERLRQRGLVELHHGSEPDESDDDEAPERVPPPVTD
ncbi:MAG: DUF4388 domain-containing protein [Acidobacteriota bacterium]